MYIAVVPNRNSPPAILLRESFREHGKVKNRGPKKVGKYFQWQLTAQGLSFRRDAERIARDAALDGIYVLRTSLKSERLDAAQTVRSYKRLAQVERAFRVLKSLAL